MSSLKYYSYDGVGKQVRESYHYSQAVRIPAGADRVECSGQGGWDPTNLAISDDLTTEIKQAFSNVELALQDAGVSAGWKGVFRVNSYHAVLDESVMGTMIEMLKEKCPDHCPIWTAVGVPNLVLPNMRVEIEVVAFDEK